MIRPGEVYWADAGNARHRMLVVSREQLNRGKRVLGVLITSKRFDVRSKFANCAVFNAGEYGFPENCVAQGESIGPILIEDIDLDEGPIAVLDELRMRDVVRAIGYTIGAECEPV
jgi:mRNA-degrading endonuclease toxin of MazEF toxin-antitoxin module